MIGLLEQLDLTLHGRGVRGERGIWRAAINTGIDILIHLLVEQVDSLCQGFPSPEYYVDADSAREAVRRTGQFNVIHPASGNKIDFIIARDDAYGRTQIQRRQRVRILPDLEGCAAAPEDIILGKLEYYRQGGSEKHLRDITGMMKVSGELVDTAYVARWAEELGVREIWQAILDRLGNGE